MKDTDRITFLSDNQPTSTKVTGKFRMADVTTVSITHMIHDIYSSFLAPILPLLIDKLGLSISLAGSLSVIQRLPSVLNPLVGILAENMKARYFIIFTPAITTVVMSLLGVAPSYGILAVLLFVAGLSSVFFHVPGPVMIKHLSGEKLGKGMSYFMAGGESARTLGPLIIVGAVTQWGLDSSYKLIPLGVFASLIMYTRLKNIDIRQDFKQRTAHVHYFSIFKTFIRTYFILGAIIFFRGAMRSALTLYLSVYLIQKGHTLWFAGISLSVLQLAGVLGTLVSGTVSDRIGRRPAMLIITTITPVLMFLFLQTNGLLLFVILILTGFFLVSPTPVFLAIIHELDTKHLLFVNSIYMTISFLLNSIMLLLVGLLSDYWGLDKTYLIAGFVAILAIPFTLMLPKKQHAN